MKKVKIAVLVSGGGTNLQALIDAEKSGIIHSGTISLVLSNVKGAYALTRAENAGIEAITVSKKELGSQEAFEEKLISELESRGIELIILAGFMSILSEKFTRRFEDRIINVHPSLPSSGSAPSPPPRPCKDQFSFNFPPHFELFAYALTVK